MKFFYGKFENKFPQWYAWLVLALLFFIYITSFVDRQIVAVLGTAIRDDLGFTNTQIGVLYGPAFSLIYAICGIFMGWFADRFSRKRIILSGLLIWSLMTVASGFASSFAFLVTARLFVGVSQSALSPAVYSLLADYFHPEKRARVFSVYASGIFIGVGCSFLIGGSVAEAYDWRQAMKTVGWPGIFLAIIGFLLIREPSRKKKGEGVQALRFFEVLKFILRKQAVQYHLAGFSLLALSGYTILAFIGTVLNDTFQTPSLIAQYGWFMFLTGLSVNASGWLADKLATKWGPEKRFVMGMVAALGGLPFYFFGLMAESALVAFLLVGTANVISSSYNGVAAALIQYFVKPDMRGMAGAVYLFVISIVGFGIGPPATGWMIDHVFTGTYGPSKALLLVFTVCGVLATICFWKAMQYYQQDAIEE
ncbi:spinster family MFS transporter [Gracilimonas mengyeensis]|uniref:Predicted arabinose efflux permease, MFS family n=1 Tax=Gracilimonas mengyeensis TaxID=1302730 RepID=A0A521F9M4_9BACT|nr:MFS transporter [Gracilimonas mengyeensis]SMO92915.1 Predicted arabinose efflux permease, MFS family [Gracilimonas mengyeensis]